MPQRFGATARLPLQRPVAPDARGACVALARPPAQPDLNPMTDATSPTLPPGTVLVLLPVYNGERFLANQIDSILSQERVQVLLLCRDDASSDRSLDIQHGNLGASANFSVLMQAALAFEAPAALHGQPVYVALADQDDHWHSDKLATGVARIRELEAQHPGLPALVHSDLRVINEDGGEIAPSMARYQGLQVQRSGFAAQLLSNTLTGCTSLMNH